MTQIPIVELTSLPPFAASARLQRMRADLLHGKKNKRAKHKLALRVRRREYKEFWVAGRLAFRPNPEIPAWLKDAARIDNHEVVKAAIDIFNALW